MKGLRKRGRGKMNGGIKEDGKKEGMEKEVAMGGRGAEREE